MAFWTSQELEAHAKSIIDPFSESSVDCNSYTLHMGDEYFCTADRAQLGGIAPTIQKLSPGQGFTIPPGQFALLLTDEKVTVPNKAMAFISIKSGFKFHGLVNVSGFHVDPGYDGRLIFSVYNAGPSPISLKQGMRLFVIWFAGLGATSEKHKSPDGGYTGIQPEHIQGMDKEVLSLQTVTEHIKAVDTALSAFRPIADNLNFFYRGIIMTVIGGLIVALAVFVIGFSYEAGTHVARKWFDESPQETDASVDQSSEPAPPTSDVIEGQTNQDSQ